MTLRLTKVLLAAAVALWGALSAVHNLLDWPGTLGAVRTATAMTAVEGGPGWQAVDHGLVVWAGALFILAGKLAAAGLCGWGVVAMGRSMRADAAVFASAKAPAVAGCGAALFMLFTGFVVVGETWFELWRAAALREPVLDSALRYGASIGLVGLFIAQREP